MDFGVIMRTGAKILFLCCVFAAALMSVSCKENTQREYWPTAAWKKASPESTGFDSEKLLAALKAHDLDALGLHSLLVVKDGFLILEAYGYPYDSNIPHNVNSVTKSFVSSLYGIALEKKMVGGVREKVLDFFPRQKSKTDDIRKLRMTVRDLLTMRSGLNWNENGAPGEESSFSHMVRAENSVNYVLDIPMMSSSGGAFNYSSGVSHLLAAILHSKCGNLETFARENLFEPVGIEGYYWKKDAQGVPMGGYGLSLKSTDMARLGFLYLNDGMWNGRQIVPKRWIKEATKKHTATGASFNPGFFYGYQWWVAPDGKMYGAQGYGGQNIFVSPAHDLIVVTTANIPFRKENEYRQLITSEIPQALDGGRALEENPEAQAGLENFCREWSQPPEKTEYTLPEAFTGTGDMLYRFDDNEKRALSLRISRQNTGGLILSYEYVSLSGGSVRSEIIAPCDNHYRVSETFFPETYYQFDYTPAALACRFVEGGDGNTIVLELMPLGVAEGPFIERITIEGERITVTRTNRVSRRNYTLSGVRTSAVSR